MLNVGLRISGSGKHRAGGGAITAPTVVQKNIANGFSGVAGVSLAPCVPGNAVVVACHGWQGTAPVLTMDDDVGNPYTLLSGPTTDPAEAGGTFRYLFICPSVAGTPAGFGSTGGGGHYWQTCAVEIAGCAASPVDAVLAATPVSGTSWNAGNIATSQDNDLILAFPSYIDFDGTTVISGGALWTLLQQLYDGGFVGMRYSVEDQVAATAGSYAVDATLAAAVHGAISAIALKGH